MTYKQHARAVLLLGLPLIGGHIAQLLIGVTDTVMLGWYSVEALAAVSLATSYAFVLFIVGSGFAFAVLPMVASAMADGTEVQVRRVTRMGMWISTLYGMAILPLLFWSEAILLKLGQKPIIADLSQDYLRLFCIGMVPSLLVMVLKSYLAALERTQVVLWVTVGAAVMNGFINYILIFGNFGAPELGLRGAAIASVIMQLVTLGLLVIYIIKVTPEHAMFQRMWRPDWEAFGDVFRLGWPIGLTMLAESGLFAASAVMMGWLGAIPLAAHGIGLQLVSLTFVVHLGLSQAATVRVGNAMGRKDGRALRDGALVAFALSVVFAAVTVVMFVVLPEFLMGLFLDPDDPDRPEIIRIGVGLMLVAALFQLVDGAQVVALALLRGLKDTKVPMIFAAISYWVVGMPVTYFFGFILEWGGQGIWFGLVTGLTCAAVLLIHRFWTRGIQAVPV